MKPVIISPGSDGGEGSGLGRMTSTPVNTTPAPSSDQTQRATGEEESGPQTGGDEVDGHEQERSEKKHPEQEHPEQMDIQARGCVLAVGTRRLQWEADKLAQTLQRDDLWLDAKRVGESVQLQLEDLNSIRRNSKLVHWKRGRGYTL